MISTDLKCRAFEAMDDAVTFELHLTSQPPTGDHVVELARAPHRDAVRPTARFFGRMAQTFFAHKLRAQIDGVEGDGPVGFYLVSTLPPQGHGIEEASAPRDVEAPGALTFDL